MSQESGRREADPAAPIPEPLATAVYEHEQWRAGRGGAPFSFEGEGPWSYDFRNRDLSCADLSWADFTKASMAGVNFTDSDLSGARLNARGLDEEQFAGADLRGAELPATLTFEGLLPPVNHLIGRADRLTTVIFLTCVSVVAICATTHQEELFAQRTSLVIPGLSINVSVRLFFLAIPLLLLGLQLSACFLISSLYEMLSQLPARFPSGRRLDQQVAPSFPNLCFLLPHYLNRLGQLPPADRRAAGQNEHRPIGLWRTRIRVILGHLPGLLLLGPAPLTIFLVWLKYLHRHDAVLMIVQSVVLVLATGCGAWSYHSSLRSLRHSGRGKPLNAQTGPGYTRSRQRYIENVSYAATAVLLVLCFAASAIAKRTPAERAPYPIDVDPIHRGISSFLPGGDDIDLPPGRTRSIRVSQMIWEWAAADLARAQLDSAQLSHDDLRRANLNGAHLANADLEYTRLDGARLVGAVLTRADLKDAHLQRAVLWEARLDSSRMREVHLDGADLGSADLRWAGLQGASFAQAKLAGARLNSAIVCGADFRDTNVTVEQLETTHGYELAVLDEPVRVKLDFLHPAPALTNDELKYGPAYLNLARGPSSTGPGEDAERERTQYQAWRAAWLQMQRVRPGTKSRFVPDSIGATLETTVLTMGEKTQIRKETVQELIREYHHDRTSRDVRMDSTEIVVLNDSLFNQVKVKARNHCVNIDGIGQ